MDSLDLLRLAVVESAHHFAKPKGAHCSFPGNGMQPSWSLVSFSFNGSQSCSWLCCPLALAGLVFSYGTAGFRADAATLDAVVHRTAILAALRSLHCGGQAMGVMVTASHNPEGDNGVKVADPSGGMLAAHWEKYATQLANAETEEELWQVGVRHCLWLGTQTETADTNHAGGSVHLASPPDGS